MKRLCLGAAILMMKGLHVTSRCPLLVHAFIPPQANHYVKVRSKSMALKAMTRSMQRRSMLVSGGGYIASLFIPQSASAHAVVMVSSDEKVFKAGQAMGTVEALARFQQAQKDLDYLITHFDDVVASGGGDNVRRYLGTVGFTSSLYGISKVLKELQDEADDIVEYTENMNEFDAYLRAADTASYSANFVEFSAAKTKPEAFFKDAFGDVQKMKEYMNNMAAELKFDKI
mmetsp:Transcript_20540/g.37325  ORF Transcript_20540/g.37325 Transcript_20540/m.37325 type:complete len:229 (-) Transcript_20540:340-1026(-)